MQRKSVSTKDDVIRILKEQLRPMSIDDFILAGFVCNFNRRILYRALAELCDAQKIRKLDYKLYFLTEWACVGNNNFRVADNLYWNYTLRRHLTPEEMEHAK